MSQELWAHAVVSFPEKKGAEVEVWHAWQAACCSSFDLSRQHIKQAQLYWTCIILLNVTMNLHGVLETCLCESEPLTSNIGSLCITNVAMGVRLSFVVMDMLQNRILRPSMLWLHALLGRIHADTSLKHLVHFSYHCLAWHSLSVFLCQLEDVVKLPT